MSIPCHKKVPPDVLPEFALSKSDVTGMVRSFKEEMVRGLAGPGGPLKMIPAYIDVPTGNERGTFLAVDLGGTNFRVLSLELKGAGRTGRLSVKKFKVDKRHMTGTGKELFDFLASCIRDFLKDQGALHRGTKSLGFTFSFPVKQMSVRSGILIHWTKGFTAKGVSGEDVVRLLSDALGRVGLGDVKVSALVNDTVGTLVAKSYSDHRCDMGVIIGTGTNACYREGVSRITKWNSFRRKKGRMIINIEWGNFNKLPRNTFDKRLDKESNNPGEQFLEKMVSGMYLGEIARLALLDFGKKIPPYSFTTEHLSIIDSDNSKGFIKTKNILASLGFKDLSLLDLETVRAISKAVTLRASRISAAAIAAVVTKIDPALKRDHTVAIDGSVYEKHPHFAKDLRRTLVELFGDRAKRIRIVLAKDGSGKGAAIIAAVAAKEV